MMRMRFFLKGSAGATALEYAMIAGLVGIALVYGASVAGAAVGARFQIAGERVAAVQP